MIAEALDNAGILEKDLLRNKGEEVLPCDSRLHFQVYNLVHMCVCEDGYRNTHCSIFGNDSESGTIPKSIKKRLKSILPYLPVEPYIALKKEPVCNGYI